jgi:hypothetical protein
VDAIAKQLIIGMCREDLARATVDCEVCELLTVLLLPEVTSFESAINQLSIQALCLSLNT